MLEILPIQDKNVQESLCLRCGADFDPDKCDIFFDDIPVVRNGGDAGTPESDLLDTVKQKRFTIRCDFHDGDADYWVWSSDISYEYVKINADYHT